MPRFLIFAAALLVSNAALAAVEPNYAPDKPPVTTPWYAEQAPAERQADLDFINGMRPHHAGALSMSKEYLSDKNASDAQLKQLAKGIIHNQEFEIGMLSRVEQLVSVPLGADHERRQIAEQGLAQKQRFTRAPMPGPLSNDNNAVSARDVQFAKAMIVHHEGALTMCKAYLAKPAATNKYLRLLCVDILTDQKQEIRFMKDAVGRYPGNPDDVKIDASMIHGMEGMHHGMGGMDHGPKHPSGHKMPAPRKVAKPPASAAPPSSGGHMDHESHMGH